jgi:putative hydrolase of the HAD superfamily
VFELSLEKLGLKKDEVVMIGDNYEKDIMWAKRFGINKAYHKVDEKLEADEDQDVIKFKIFSEIKEDF